MLALDGVLLGIATVLLTQVKSLLIDEGRPCHHVFHALFLDLFHVPLVLNHLADVFDLG